MPEFTFPALVGSNGTGRPVGSGEHPGLRLAGEIFVVPQGDDFIVYGPLQGALLLVNGGAIGLLRDIERGTVLRTSAPEPVLRRLVEAGVVLDGDAPPGPVPPRAREGDFDPDGVTLLLTTSCSLRCVYCYASGGERARTMDFGVARAAIDWMADHAARRGKRRFSVVFHGGGDVATAPDLLRRCVDHARERAGATGATVTFEAGLNGVAGGAVLDWLIENLHGATVSLDGLPEIHDRQRPLPDGRGSFDRVAASLRRMDERGFPYTIRSTVTRDGLERLADSVEMMASSFGARAIQAEPVFPAGRALANDLAAVDPEAFVREFRRARRRARAHGKELRYSGARSGTLAGAFCKAAGGGFAVTPQGWVTSCYEVSERDDPRSRLFFFGRLDPATMRLALDPERLVALARLRCEGKPFCARCFCKWHCAGDCPAKLAASGDPLDPSASPRCHVNRELTLDQLRERLGLEEDGRGAT